eukprot:symbB.v1.2.009578.t1/scaffold611.1/size181545/1
MVTNWWKMRQDFIKEFAAQEELFHQYQAQMEEESNASNSDSGEEDEWKSTKSGKARTSSIEVDQVEEQDINLASLDHRFLSDEGGRCGSMEKSSGVDIEQENGIKSTTQGDPATKKSRYTIRSASFRNLDTALLMSSKSLIAYEWGSEWVKAKGRRRGLFTSCKAPRDFDHVTMPRLLFPVIRPREGTDMEEEDEDEHRWNQAIKWAEVLAYRFLMRQDNKNHRGEREEE